MTDRISFLQRDADSAIFIGRGAPSAKRKRKKVSVEASLRLLAKVPGGPELERCLHRKFSAARLKEPGWFQPVPVLLAYIDEVKKLDVARDAAPTEPPPTAPAKILRDVTERAAREEWIAAIQRHRGNLTRVGAEYGISQPSASVRTRRLGLSEFAARVKASYGVEPCGRPPKPRKSRRTPRTEPKTPEVIS